MSNCHLDQEFAGKNKTKQNKKSHKCKYNFAPFITWISYQITLEFVLKKKLPDSTSIKI